MRTPIAWTAALLLLALASCSAVQTGPDPIAGHGFRGVVHVSGDFDGQAFLEAAPVTALVRGHGNATLTLRAFPPPYVVIDGDWNLVVEPAPQREAEAIQAVQRGEILIRRAGIPGALNKPGTRDAYKATLLRQATGSSSAPTLSDSAAPSPVEPVCTDAACRLP